MKILEALTFAKESVSQEKPEVEKTNKQFSEYNDDISWVCPFPWTCVKMKYDRL